MAKNKNINLHIDNKTEAFIEDKLNEFYKKIDVKINTVLPIMNELKNVVAELQATSKILQDDCAKITQSISFLSDKYEDISNRTSVVEAVVHKQDTTIKKLSDDLTNLNNRLACLEAEKIVNNIKISCVPHQEDEDLIKITKNIFETANIVYNEKEVVVVQRDINKSKDIIIQAKNNDIKQNWLISFKNSFKSLLNNSVDPNFEKKKVLC